MRFLLVLLFLPTFAGVATAQTDAEGSAADPSQHLDEAARILFQEGTRAYDAGRFDEARRRYENAFELSRRPELLYNIAQCHDRLDERPQALEFYQRFVTELPESSRAAVVNSRIEVLRRSLAEAGSPDEANDPEGEEASDVPEDAAPDESRSLVGPITAFAVGGAGLITFAVAGIIAGARYGDAEAECNATGCNEDSLSGVQTAALVADIGLGVGIAGAAVGVIWLLVGGGDGDEETASAPVLVPTVSAQYAGLSVQGGF